MPIYRAFLHLVEICEQTSQPLRGQAAPGSGQNERQRCDQMQRRLVGQLEPQGEASAGTAAMVIAKKKAGPSAGSAKRTVQPADFAAWREPQDAGKQMALPASRAQAPDADPGRVVGFPSTRP